MFKNETLIIIFGPNYIITIVSIAVKTNLNITDKQARFIDEYLIDLNGTQAAIRAGYSKRSAKEQAHRLLTYAHVQAELEEKRIEMQRKHEINRDGILEGFQEAFELAKESNNPGAMTGAYREIAKMCGFYEPEKKKVEITQEQLSYKQRYELMSDEELLAIIVSEKSSVGDIC